VGTGSARGADVARLGAEKIDTWNNAMAQGPNCPGYPHWCVGDLRWPCRELACAMPNRVNNPGWDGFRWKYPTGNRQENPGGDLTNGNPIGMIPPNSYQRGPTRGSRSENAQLVMAGKGSPPGEVSQKMPGW